MTNTLVLVESPAKCKKIESYLGPGYKVMATFGHIRTIADLKSIDIDNQFHTNFSIIQDNLKLKQIEKIRNEITNADDVIIATDDDREGESIGWHICDLFNLPLNETKRIVFHEITESAIQSAIFHPKLIDMNLVHAQQSRQILDLLVGYTISPILWSSLTQYSSLSAGRCQTPALRLVYDNYIDIKNSPGKLIYTIYGNFTQHNLTFELKKTYENKEQVEEFLELCKNYEFIYSSFASSRSIKKNPEPLTTSSLLQIASNELNMSPKQTMKSAQILYENGFITYMRTDSKKYSEEFIEKIKEEIKNKYGENYVNASINDMVVGKTLTTLNTNKKTKAKAKTNVPPPQEAHEAIRPVELIETITNNDIDTKTIKLYELIYKHTMESCMCSAQYMRFSMQIQAPNDTCFIYSNEYPVFLGWKIIQRTNKIITEERSIEQIYNYASNLKNPQTFKPGKIEAKFSLTNIKSHFTEAKLVSLLEEKGIGRPSTFASLVDKIQEREYVKKQNIDGIQVEHPEYSMLNNEIIQTQTNKTFGNEHNKLVIQPLGIIVIEFLIEHFNSFFNYEYTKDMEDILDEISKGNYIWHQLCQNCHNMLVETTKLTQNNKFCIQIDDEHSIIIGKYGPVVKQTNGDKTSFIPLKKNVKIDDLIGSTNIKLDDVIETNIINPESIGKYKGKDLFIKKGKYGTYAQWGNETKSIKEFNTMPIEHIKYIDVLKSLERDNILDPSKPVGLIRELNKNLSIRTGKYGDYIFYKKPRAKKPEFHKLNGFKDDYHKCDKQLILNWIKLTYNIE
jgi:DNA topoisomerase-1